MRTSLSEIQQIEKYLRKEMTIEDALVFEARILSNPLLRMNLFLQQNAYSLVKLYHRKKLKEKTEIIHQRLFTHSDKKEFQELILNLFQK